MMPERSLILSLIALSAIGASAGASPIDDIQWATIGSPGNAPFVQDYGNGFSYTAGRVDYEYRIAKTEVTGAQWLEFVNAYAPFVDPEYANNSEFTSFSITRVGGPGSTEYYMPPALAQRPVEAGWRFGARFVNWLHNGRANTREAFESGVYTTSTFGENPDGSFTDQAARTPGATYFLVTRDEWVKSAYFDPNRHGEGQPGYWRYPHSSDVPPVGGPPGVGETSADYFWFPGLLPPVGAYPETRSPWGLLDLSGGVREWTETTSFSGRIVRGTSAIPTIPEFHEHITYEFGSDAGAFFGFRIGMIPCPSTMTMIVVGATLLRRRR